MAKLSEQQITGALMEDIKSKLQVCLFMLCENSIHLQDKEFFGIPYETPDSLKQMQDSILKYTKALPETLKLDMGGRDAAIQEIMSLNKSIIDAAESIYCYYSLNNILQEIIIHYQRLSIIRQEKEVALDMHGFYHDCLDFVADGEDDNARREQMSKLVKTFPLKMAREKYYDYVARGVQYFAKEASPEFMDDMVRSLKFRFMPTCLDNYGLHYPMIKDTLSTMLQSDFQDMDTDALLEAYTTLDENLETLNDISDYLSVMHENTNFLTLILSFCKDLDYLLEDQMTYKDILFTTIENIFKTEADAFRDNLLDMINTASEGIVDKIIAFEMDTKLSETLQGGGFSEDARSVLQIHHVVTNGYYETLADVTYPVRPWAYESSLATDAYKSEKTAGLLDYIKNTLETMPPAVQRIVKRLFLDSFPSPFTQDEFGEYVSYIIDSATDFTSRLQLLDATGSLFEATGFAERLDGHQNHSHDHNCGHGHHH